MTLKFRVEKLIRDRLPTMMRNQGLTVFDRVLEMPEFRSELKRKLMEEAAEAFSARSTEELLEELADLSEVVRALAVALGSSPDEIEKIRQRKHAERGGFEGRTYSERVEGDAELAAIKYYVERPDQYPAIPL